MRRDAFFRAMAASIGQLGCVAVPLFLLAAFSVQPARAQTPKVVIDCLPPWETNNRFLQSTRIKHPGLSLNGFDCGDNCKIGYGLKQVLEKVYGSETETEVQTVFKAIVEQAKENFQDISSFKKIRDNTGRLQAKGFIALASYVLENNDYDPTTLNPALPSSVIAVENFRTALVESKWKLNKDHEDDGVKWASPVMNVARAIDFYLALENAYKHYDLIEYDNTVSRNILSINDKDTIMDAYINLIQGLERLADTEVPEWLSRMGSNRYNFEPGNASLKAQLSVGYAALTWQEDKVNNPDGINGKISRYIARSFESVLSKSGVNRGKYWGYQSEDGKSFWAEGAYYFHLTLSQVIPFLHSVRINNMIKTYGYNVDPFRDNWLLNPLHWLADISTPDGKTPPLDDGHKINMYNASVLRWTNDYGDKDIGEKFAYISKPLSRSWLYPVGIAIPRIAKPMENPLLDVSGNTFENRKSGEDGRQEVVVRRTINGKQHYILLNGESGDAVVRGEGHEQGDQMQLLYYVDDISYLADSGYDRPMRPLISQNQNWKHSTWNPYTNHNVMTMEPDQKLWYDNNGGVRSPWLNVLRKARVQSYHQSVNEIYHQEYGNIDLIYANIDLKAADGEDLNTNVKTFAYYYRNILFIRDPNNPYLVDINSINGDKQDRQNWYKMYYHVNSNDASTLNYPVTFQFAGIHWDNVYSSDGSLSPAPTNNAFFIQPFTVERTLYWQQEPDIIRESYIADIDRGIGIDIKKLMLRGNHHVNGTSKENFTTIALMRPLFNGEQNPALAQGNVPLPDDNDRAWQYITWMQDSVTVDVIISRSEKYYANPVSSGSFSRTYLSFPVPEADSFYVGLPSNMNYGFARLIKEKDIWNIDPNFQLNLEKSVPQVTISGPSCIGGENSTGYYSSSASGGKPPYSYSWSFYRLCTDANSDAISSSLGPKCNAWNSIGSASQARFGGYNGQDFKIRLTLTDSSSPRQSATSSELPVRVLSSTEGSCPSDTPEDIPGDVSGKRGMDSAQPLALNESLSEAKESIPEAYALRQNFPNPFNPSTEILFDLPETTMVSLVVYDVLGREIARLVEGELPAGSHRARFDAGSLPSGVYLYRIQAEDFVDTGRMLLLK